MVVGRVGLSALAVTALLASCGKSSGDGARRSTGGSAATAGSGAAAASTTAGSSSAGRANQGGAAGSTVSSAAGGTGATDMAGAVSGDGGSSAGSSRGTGGSSVHAGGSSAQGGEAGSSEAGTGNPSHGGEDGGTVPLTLFIMFDRSWSMRECGDGSTTDMTNNTLSCPTLSRWELTSQALTQFVQDPAAAGVLVALRFFPDDRPAQGCDGYVGTTSGFTGGFGTGGMDGGLPVDAGSSANCDISACAQPLVREAALTADAAPTDVQEAALVAAIQSSEPPGPDLPNPDPATPTYPALAGAEQWALAYSADRPGQQTAIVLVTDGEQMGCDTSNTHIAALAANGKDGGVLTYVVGLSGSNETALNQIAAAGGTEKAFLVQDGGTVVADLMAALTAIRDGHP